MFRILQYYPDLVDDLKLQYSSDGYSKGPIEYIDPKTGELETGEYRKHIGSQKDFKEFIKMYDNAIEWVFDLSKAEQRIMKMIAKQIIHWRKDQDFVYLTYKSAQVEFDYDRHRSEFYGALKSLEKKQVIKRDEARIGRLYVDPKSFYKGDRRRPVKKAAELHS